MAIIERMQDSAQHFPLFQNSVAVFLIRQYLLPLCFISGLYICHSLIPILQPCRVSSSQLIYGVVHVLQDLLFRQFRFQWFSIHTVIHRTTVRVNEEPVSGIYQDGYDSR